MKLAQRLSCIRQQGASRCSEQMAASTGRSGSFRRIGSFERFISVNLFIKPIYQFVYFCDKIILLNIVFLLWWFDCGLTECCFVYGSYRPLLSFTRDLQKRFGLNESLKRTSSKKKIRSRFKYHGRVDAVECRRYYKRGDMSASWCRNRVTIGLLPEIF